MFPHRYELLRTRIALVHESTTAGDQLASDFASILAAIGIRAASIAAYDPSNFGSGAWSDVLAEIGAGSPDAIVMFGANEVWAFKSEIIL